MEAALGHCNPALEALEELTKYWQSACLTTAEFHCNQAVLMDASQSSMLSLLWLLLMGCCDAVQVFVASNDLRVQEAASQPTRLTYAVSAEHLLKDMAAVRPFPML